jgi:hypothetical protein
MKYYMGVASKNHVEIGKKFGIIQLCHGKSHPLEKLQPNDWIIYYSPKLIYGEDNMCQEFTAIAQITESPVYVVDGMARRSVLYYNNRGIKYQDLKNELMFSSSYFRFGFFEIGLEDFTILYNGMV